MRRKIFFFFDLQIIKGICIYFGLKIFLDGIIELKKCSNAVMAKNPKNLTVTFEGNILKMKNKKCMVGDYVNSETL